MQILIFLCVGMLACWFAGKILKGKGFGLIGNINVGGIGAFVGEFLFRVLGVNTAGFIGFIKIEILSKENMRIVSFHERDSINCISLECNTAIPSPMIIRRVNIERRKRKSS